LLIIRAKQIAVLDAAMLASFRRRMLAHLQSVFPEHTATWGEHRTVAVIDASVSHAGRFGIVAERDVARFVGLVVGLGPEFPDRPETAWTHELLQAPHLAPDARVDRLYAGLEPQFPTLAPLWQAWRT